jgi:outer membrane lipase/esterase
LLTLALTCLSLRFEAARYKKLLIVEERMKAALTLGAALLASVVVVPSVARAGNFYVFGDSLVDDGNIPKLTGLDYPPPPYYHNEFSNGPVWAQYVPGLLGLGFSAANDYGVGGAFAGPLSVGGATFNNLENLPPPTGEGFATPLPSFLEEVQSFAATGTRLSNSDVVGIWVGANDYFAALGLVDAGLANPAVIIPATVATVATQTAQGIEELSGLGARRFIVFTLPPLGDTPLFNTSGAATIAAADAISQAHGEALALTMEDLHYTQGTNVILINQTQLFSELLADPALYGKTNVTAACLYTPSCVTAGTAAQNQYLFWDDVHPTTGTHLLIAEYAANAVNAVADLAAPAQMAAAAAGAFASALNARLDGLRSGAQGFALNVPSQGMVAQLGSDDASGPPAVGHLSGFFTGNYDYGNRNAQGANNAFNYSIGTFAAGLDDRVMDSVVVGAALGYGDESGTATGGTKLSANAYQFGFYAALVQPDYYMNLKLAVGFDDFRNTRPGVVAGNIVAKPGGATYDFGGDFGYLLHCGELTYGPVAGLDVTDSHVAAYTETGDPALTQSVNAQDDQVAVLDAGAQAATTVSLGNAVLKPHLSATLDDVVSGNGGNFDSVFTDEPLVPLTTSYGKQTRYFAVIGGGLSASLSETLSLAADFSTTVAKADGEDHEFSAALRYAF